jgi:hypothetical protein
MGKQPKTRVAKMGKGVVESPIKQTIVALMAFAVPSYAQAVTATEGNSVNYFRETVLIRQQKQKEAKMSQATQAQVRGKAKGTAPIRDQYRRAGHSFYPCPLAPQALPLIVTHGWPGSKSLGWA